MYPVPALYDLALQKNIEIMSYPMAENGSMSIMLDSGRCFIGIDESVLDGGVEERCHIGHELGHCLTGSFYNRYTRFDIRQRHENRADKWAIREMIPVEALDEAIADGCCEIWELADRFGVTEPFIKKAICLYVHGNVASELYF
jgi:hypothetical protein